MLEVYRDDLRDLLQDGKELPLTVKKDPKGTVNINNIVEVPTKSFEEMEEALDKGGKRRHIAATKMNSESSRSHLIFSIIIENTNLNTGATSTGKISLCDLAGSERIKKSGVTGDGMKEAQSINKSLTALGDVIEALSQNRSHIPYRNHKLTLLMSDSLGGNAKTLMFVNVSPAKTNMDETTTSLIYASRAKLITNSAKKNEDGKQVAALKKVIASLTNQLKSRDSLLKAHNVEIPAEKGGADDNDDDDDDEG
eukprot:GFYU01010925.1.p1 GENE.GFYU01010925.1~~GFYU01010925.1.p1  ORF type:complete len:253 (-),score=98.30 GFYU01010925.1:146-904(-)